MATHQEYTALFTETERQRFAAIAFGLMKGDPDAEDVLQEAYLALVEMTEEKIEQVNGPMSHFFTGIIKHKVADYYKKKCRTIYELPDIQSLSTEPLFNIDLKIIQKIFRAMLKEPDPRIFDLLCMNFKYKQIAAIIQRNESYVRKRIFRFRPILLKIYNSL